MKFDHDWKEVEKQQNKLGLEPRVPHPITTYHIVGNHMSRLKFIVLGPAHTVLLLVSARIHKVRLHVHTVKISATFY